MSGIKEIKHSIKTATSDSKSEDLHDDSNKIYDSFQEKMEFFPLTKLIK